MTARHTLSRRGLLAMAAGAPWAVAASNRRIPVGLELYSVRKELAKDPNGVVSSVAKMGYQDVEFYAPYFKWTSDEASDMRKLLDELGITCWSTHNDATSFSHDGLAHAIELNHILGSKYVIWASAGRPTDLDGWKKVADTLNGAAEAMKPAGLRPGYHNHKLEFMPVEGKRPIEILAANTGTQIVLQLDVGTCLEAGSDPVAWINANPGRIVSMHCKDWAPGPGKGYEVLFGEGVAPWREIFEAAEKTGGIEHYLIEQEGSRYPPLETAQRCLTSFRTIHDRA
jgi:sugar phosphate isomerase/epimerase